MSAIIEGIKRTTLYDLASVDIAGTYLWSKEVTDKMAETTLLTKNGPKCYDNYVPSVVPGQPEELDKLTIYGVRISAEDPSMVIMHEASQNFPYKQGPEAMQEIKKIMQTASKDEISMDASIDDPFAPI